MFLWLKTLYRKRAVTWPFIFYTIIWTLSGQLFLEVFDSLSVIIQSEENKLKLMSCENYDDFIMVVASCC